MRGQEPLQYRTLHRFTPGLYSRTVILKKGSVVISFRHRTKHQFFILKGLVQVWTQDRGIVTMKAPFSGTTEAGTIRAVHVLEDCVWTTCHATQSTTVAEVEKELFEVPDLGEAP